MTMTTQFGGPIGPFLDRVQQRGVQVMVSGSCAYTYAGPPADPAAIDQHVRARVVDAVKTVIAPRMASGQLTFRNLGEGTLGDLDNDIIAATGLQPLGIQLGDLAMRFAIDGGPPQREVRAKIRVGGFTIDASSKHGVDVGKLGQQAIAKAKNALVWYLLTTVLVLAIVGGVVWYLKHTVKKALTEPSASAKAAMTWDGKSPLACGGGDEIRIEGVTATLPGTAITANGGCKLTLVNVSITAPDGLEAVGNATITMKGGTIAATGRAVHALGNAKVVLEGTHVTGKLEKLGGATITGP